MRKRILLLGAILISGLAAMAQSKETIRIKTGEQVPVKEKYLYPQFAPGTVYLRNGQTPTVPLNYHLMLREIQFLAPAGDTLTLDQLHTVKNILLNGDIFVFDQNATAMKVLGEYGPVLLAVNLSLQVTNVDKEAAYGQSSSLSSITSYSSYPIGNGSIAQLQMKGDVVYSHRRNYYFISQNQLSFPTTKKSILKLFPRQKAAINNFLKEHPIQFNNPDDLKTLLEFCAGNS